MYEMISPLLAESGFLSSSLIRVMMAATAREDSVDPSMAFKVANPCMDKEDTEFMDASVR
jgi:hypothetical protein